MTCRLRKLIACRNPAGLWASSCRALGIQVPDTHPPTAKSPLDRQIGVLGQADDCPGRSFALSMPVERAEVKANIGVVT